MVWRFQDMSVTLNLDEKTFILGSSPKTSFVIQFVAHLSKKCSWWAIVVSQCPSCVVRHAVSTIALKKKGKRKAQGVPQSQTAALPRPQEEEETDKSKQAQIEQTYEKH